MAVVRTYGCECGHEWTVFHHSSDESYPDCPRCSAPEPAWRPQAIAIKGNKARAIDLAQTIAEEDYGLTNMRDNTREGETAAMDKPAETTAEREKRMQATADLMKLNAQAEANPVQLPPQLQKPVSEFWGGPKGNKPGPRLDMLNIGKMGSLAARQGGVDPMAMLHKGVRKGEIAPVRTNIIAKG